MTRSTGVSGGRCEGGVGTAHIITGLLDGKLDAHGRVGLAKRILRSFETVLRTHDTSEEPGHRRVGVRRGRNGGGRHPSPPKRTSCPVLGPNHCWMRRPWACLSASSASCRTLGIDARGPPEGVERSLDGRDRGFQRPPRPDGCVVGAHPDHVSVDRRAHPPPDPAPLMPREFSCGGLVLDPASETPACIVIVPTRRAADGAKVLALPKGHPDPGESAEGAALREVREETGIDAELRAPLGEVSYHYQRGGRSIAKTVRYFLMGATGGSLEDHDHEVELARWMPLEEAVAQLTYAGEREIVQRAMAALASG